MIPRACSELADLVIRKAVIALNNCEPAMPARMIWALAPVGPLARASKITRAKAQIAPAKAPAESDTAPAPNPSTATSTAPVEAPADIPNR